MSKLHYKIAIATKSNLIQYPCIRQHVETQALFLLQSASHGTVLTGVNQGNQYYTLVSCDFKAFIGDVTLTQE